MLPTLLLAAAASIMSVASVAVSPYVAEQSRAIKALSEQEIADYTAGKGMGFAKAAELNGYPGPLHVLELAGELELTAQQKRETEALFERMRERASSAGKRLIDEERRLDQLFASKSIAPESLQQELTAIAALQREVRQAHLEAHLKQARILSAAQTAKYAQLRGYGASDAHGAHGTQGAGAHHKH